MDFSYFVDCKNIIRSAATTAVNCCPVIGDENDRLLCRLDPSNETDHESFSFSFHFLLNLK